MTNQRKRKSVILSAVLVFAGLFPLWYSSPAASKNRSLTANAYERASEYSKQKRGLSILVIKSGRIVFEEYQNGHARNKGHRLASGTKSFSGVTLAAAIDDGLIESFDERVSDTITEWKQDSRKSRVTVRQLLSLTSGIDAGRIGRPPTYSEAVVSPARYDAGERFQYGPAPFQIFGELMRRKLTRRNETVMGYMKRRILDPIGVIVSDWKTQDNQPNLPSGAKLTARDWAKFGKLLVNQGMVNGKRVVSKEALRVLVKGSDANPNYGITFWLNRSTDGEIRIAARGNRRGGRFGRLLGARSETDRVSQNGIAKGLPSDIYSAAGAGKQRLYIIPSEDLVVVRQGRQSNFKDSEFLGILLGRK